MAGAAPDPSSASVPPTPQEPAKDDAAAPALAGDADGLPTFPNETEMLVMPFTAFVSQQRICKSIKVWREKALKEGALVDFGGTTGYDHCIFISHTWWDRLFTDSTSDPTDQYDKGAPDKQSGPDKDLKYKLICKGVENLIKQQGLDEDEVALWIDWQSIYQDDKAEKLKGVMSLIKVCMQCTQCTPATPRP